MEAKDYSALAKKEHLKPLELELRRIEDTVEMVRWLFVATTTIVEKHLSSFFKHKHVLFFILFLYLD